MFKLIVQVPRNMNTSQIQGENKGHQLMVLPQNSMRKSYKGERLGPYSLNENEGNIHTAQ